MCRSLLSIVLWLTAIAAGQDLAPRAYIITPAHSTAVNLTWSFYNGGLNFNGTLPIKPKAGCRHSSFGNERKKTDARAGQH